MMAVRYVAICLCSFTATKFVTQESACLLLLPQSDFQKTLRVRFPYIFVLYTFFSSKLIFPLRNSLILDISGYLKFI